MTYTPTDTANYITASSTVSVTMNPKALTVTGITASDKGCDGNTTPRSTPAVCRSWLEFGRFTG